MRTAAAPYRYQQVFPAADFAALGNQPHFLVSHTARPDQSQTSPRTVHFPDIEIRLSTMPVGPPNLSLVFDDNLGSDVMQYYRGPLNWVADAASGPGPREFYHAEFPAGVTPFLYDPSQGNLLLDVIAWQGEFSLRSSETKSPAYKHPCMLLTHSSQRKAFGTRLRSFSSRLFQCLSQQHSLC